MRVWRHCRCAGSRAKAALAAAQGVSKAKVTAVDVTRRTQKPPAPFNTTSLQAAAAAEGISPSRTRLITGRALEVLPRLADSSYDLVLADGAKDEYPDYVEEAARLLRTGGVLAVDNTLWHDKVADPAQRDPDTIAIRGTLTALQDDERWLVALLPVGDGLLTAVRR